MRWGITVNMSECHTLVLLHTLPDVTDRSPSSTVKGEVGGGITTSGLFFHGTDRACALGDTRIKDELCTKKKCSLCAIIRDSFDVERTGICGFLNSSQTS